jgi:hypothetical protein
LPSFRAGLAPAWDGAARQRAGDDRHQPMNRILEPDCDNRRAVVEAGVVNLSISMRCTGACVTP